MSIGSNLLRFSDRKLLLFDMESQRLNLLDDNLPFECAWIVADMKKVHCRNTYYLKWPDFNKRMSKEAAVITRFNPSWVENGEDPEKVLDIFESYLFDEQYIIAGHNILGFDCMLHQLWRRALGRKPNWSYLPRIIDTHLVARAQKEGWKPDHSDLLGWQYKCMSSYRKGIKTGIAALCKEWEIPIDETRTHAADYDLELNWQIYKKLVNMIEI